MAGGRFAANQRFRRTDRLKFSEFGAIIAPDSFASADRPRHAPRSKTLSLKRDQKFFDLYSVTIGGLALFGLAIFFGAKKLSDVTQGVYTTETEEYQEQIANRLRPLGQVYLPGEEEAAMAPQVAAVEASAPVETLLSGPQVYNEACLACHGAGIGGAPMLTDAANWAPRIDQGLDTLRQHAIEGYTGSAGYMPPKGGRLDLSDEEIYAAIDYMVGEAQAN